MQLLAPSYLWFLLAAAIPPILYLLFRRRRQETAWGAMYILRLVMESKSKQTIWIQYLIIFLRALAFAAIALALTQPYRPWRPPTDGAFPAAPHP